MHEERALSAGKRRKFLICFSWDSNPHFQTEATQSLSQPSPEQLCLKLTQLRKTLLDRQLTHDVCHYLLCLAEPGWGLLAALHLMRMAGDCGLLRSRDCKPLPHYEEALGGSVPASTFAVSYAGLAGVQP